MSNIFKNHWLVIFFAFLVGLIIFLPNTISTVKIGQDFQGIYPTFNNDETYYLGITKEVYDGNVNSGNPFLREHKNDLALQPLYFELIPAMEAKLLGLSVPEVFVFNDFLLPFLGVILLYILIFSLTNNLFISNTFSFTFYLIFATSFNRPISPQLGFIFFLLGIFIIWKIISKKHDLKVLLLLNVFLAIVFSGLVYIYPFYWTAIIVLYVVALLMIIIKEGGFLYWFKGCLIFALFSALFLLPYGLNMLKIIKDPSFVEASIRNGLVFTHWPGALFNVFFILFCLPIVYLSYEKFRNTRSLFFCFALLSSGVILNWQNVLTGKMLQFSSHYYIVTILFIFLVLSVLIKNIWQFYTEHEEKNYKKPVAVLLIAVLFLLIIYKQKIDFIDTYKNIISPLEILNVQSLMPVLDWFNRNTPPDSVIFVLSKEYDILIPIYTQNDVYRSGYAGMSLVSDDELENRWIVQNYWGDINADVVKNAHRSIWINKFQDTYANKEVRRKIFQLVTGNQYPETILIEQKYIDRVLEKYNKFKEIGFEKAIKTYGVDYIILDTSDSVYSSLELRFKKYSFLQNIVKIGNTIIYKVN